MFLFQFTCLSKYKFQFEFTFIYRQWNMCYVLCAFQYLCPSIRFSIFNLRLFIFHFIFFFFFFFFFLHCFVSVECRMKSVSSIEMLVKYRVHYMDGMWMIALKLTNDWYLRIHPFYQFQTPKHRNSKTVVYDSLFSFIFYPLNVCSWAHGLIVQFLISIFCCDVPFDQFHFYEYIYINFCLIG